MKYLAALLILFFCTLHVFGQQDYFIYLQTENGQPFYTRIKNNVYSSTGAGYLILSKIPDSTTSITIGFPKNVFPEQQFNIPVNHKDGGYLIKNFGDKGWGLFNLQNASLIMTTTPPEEKKKSEINGTRKNDSFSLLLANAVNDSAVLYTAVKPAKPAPRVVAAEKKVDTASHVNPDVPQKDSIALVKKPVPDSIHEAKIKKTDTAAIVHAKHVGDKDLGIAKNKPAAKDTIAKNANALTKQPLAKPVARNNAPVVAKSTAPKKKDSTVVTHILSLFRGKEKKSTAKNNPERKDTIILMNGHQPAPAKTIVAKNTAVKTDTAVIKKQILQAPEEKRDALLNNRDAVVIGKVPVQKDTARAADSPVEASSKDSSFNPPAKRLRPWVSKVAELLTDTSYIAVFVDESKEKFDTIRISIPFNELLAFSRLEKPITKLPDASADKKIKEDILADSIERANKKQDLVNAEKITRDSIALLKAAKPEPTIRTDSSMPVKNKFDSTASIANEKAPAKNELKTIASQTDSTRNVPTQPSSTVNNESPKPTTDSAKTAFAPVQRDSTPIIKDTTTAKARVQPLFFNSDCKEVALDGDIDKLRIKMLVVSSDEDRIALAKKLFKQKCMLVKQVRALSELFKTDEGKYKWLDAAYPFVSDTGNFSALGELIKDEYYLNRFKAMLRH